MNLKPHTHQNAQHQGNTALSNSTTQAKTQRLIPENVLDAVRMLTWRMSPPSASLTKTITSAKYEKKTHLN